MHTAVGWTIIPRNGFTPLLSRLLRTEIKSPPFEVTEMGWGEFEAKMTMHFKDPSEKPVDILHQLRLYHDAAAGTTQPKKARNATWP